MQVWLKRPGKVFTAYCCRKKWQELVHTHITLILHTENNDPFPEISLGGTSWTQKSTLPRRREAAKKEARHSRATGAGSTENTALCQFSGQRRTLFLTRHDFWNESFPKCGCTAYAFHFFRNQRHEKIKREAWRRMRRWVHAVAMKGE